jgi:uncharacterized damage-inducible protein DinB
MTTTRDLQFAPWVAPIAAAHRDVREETLLLARSVSDADLARETGDRGWCVRDEFVHIAASESNVVKVLGAVTSGGTPDMSFFNDLDANNARVLEASRGRSIQSVTDDLDQHGRDLQILLARLTPDDQSRTYAGLPFPIGQLVAGYQGHEPYHLEQIRTAVRGGGATS